MNKQRRNKIKAIKKLLMVGGLVEDALSMLEDVLDDEEAAYDNIPEPLTYSQRAEDSEDAIDNLSNAIDELDKYLSSNKRSTVLEKKYSMNAISFLNQII